ncbi:MAG TPA: cytochrome c peroxidase [Polyangiaceae bacterium]|nr:cytochrome c peroxidase [Polyangiaceae bacterium]
MRRIRGTVAGKAAVRGPSGDANLARLAHASAIFAFVEFPLNVAVFGTVLASVTREKKYMARCAVNVIAATALALCGTGCGKEGAVVSQARGSVANEVVGPIARIEPATGLDAERVALGRDLFYEPRLSGDGTLACASCHDLAHGGADHVAFSQGAAGAQLGVNTPTVFNSALNFRQFWDGRAMTLEEQVDGPLLSVLEMRSSWANVLAAVRTDASLAPRFAKSYSRGVTEEAVKDALATFERSLTTPDAPFDRYLGGEAAAISAQASHGYELFTSYGCSACHQGRGVGGNMFQKLGVMRDYFADRGHETVADQGRFNVTHDEADRHVFKVPSLRNVAQTAPYLHDGSVGTLSEAVHVMARYQLGRDLDANDTHDLVAFLEALSGTYGGQSQ